MVKKKKSIKRGKQPRAFKKTKNSNRKIKNPKNKPRRVRSHSKPRKKKIITRKHPRTRRKASKPRLHVKLAPDTRLWRDRERRKGAKPRALYTTKSLQSRNTREHFRIKKKAKQLKPVSPSKQEFRKIAKQAARYLQFKKGGDNPKSVYMKIAYKDNKGKLKFASIKRQVLRNTKDLVEIINGIKFQMKAYGKITIVGYEIEETIE